MNSEIIQKSNDNIGMLIEHFQNNTYNKNKIIEHIGVGNSSSSETYVTTEQTNTNQQEITTNTNTTQSNTTDASTTSTNNVNSKTQVDNSQSTSNVNITDNKSTQNLSNSQENINVDNSQIINETKQDIRNEMVQSCGAAISDVEGAISIVEDNSINTNIDASNTIVVTGNGNTMSNITLDSNVQFSSPNVDRSCMLDLMNELDTELDAINDNSKEFKGGEGGDVGAEAGGNTTSNENTTGKSDQLDASMDAGQTVENSQTLDTSQTTETDAGSDMTNTTDQTSSTEASSAASTGVGGAGAGISLTYVIVIAMIVLCFVMKDEIMSISGGFPNVLKNEDNMLYLILGGLVLYYMLTKSKCMKLDNLMENINSNKDMISIVIVCCMVYLVFLNTDEVSVNALSESVSSFEFTSSPSSL